MDIKPLKNTALQGNNETLKNILLTQPDTMTKEEFLGLFGVLWRITESKKEVIQK